MILPPISVPSPNSQYPFQFGVFSSFCRRNHGEVTPSTLAHEIRSLPLAYHAVNPSRCRETEACPSSLLKRRHGLASFQGEGRNLHPETRLFCVSPRRSVARFLDAHRQLHPIADFYGNMCNCAGGFGSTPNRQDGCPKPVATEGKSGNGSTELQLTVTLS